MRPSEKGGNSCSMSGIRMPGDVAINRAPIPSEAEFLRPGLHASATVFASGATPHGAP